MITSTEALTFDRVALTVQEKQTLEAVERCIDSAIFKFFDGGSFNIEEPVATLSPKLVAAIRRKYEAGGWRVSASTADRPAGLVYVLTFSPAPVATPAEHEPVTREVTLYAHAYCRVHVRMATRSRPEQAISVLTQYSQLAGMPVTIEAVIDEDDATMNNAVVLQQLNAICDVITIGRHKSKVAAFNAGRVTDWDILIPASDDMVPNADYALEIVGGFHEHFPHFDGALYFDDGYQHKNCATIPFMGQRFYDQFGYVYHPSYKSLWCDQEQTDLWIAMGRLVYVDKVVIEHRHPVTGRALTDALYAKNDALWSEDKAVYEVRKKAVQPHAQFAFDSPPLWLSICIATMPSRFDQIAKLVDHLYAQILTFSPRCAEIVIDGDPGTIGDKRQRLLERAKGHFVVFVDDDDWVASDYVARIVTALRQDPMADCTDMNGHMTTNGENQIAFFHSIRHREWTTEIGGYMRPPNHLNPIRRELALQVGFKPMMFGEDFDFSTRLQPLIKKETAIAPGPLYFYWFKEKPAP